MSAAPTRKVVNLALQGGGAHGAFTWGALDRLLDDDGIEIEGITATSAGAMNAAALKQGWLEDGAEGAKASLRRFWLGIAGIEGDLSDAMLAWLRAVSPSPAFIARTLEFSPTVLAAETVMRTFSPYQLNPFGYHPLREVAENLLDYGLVCSSKGQKLFVTATNVRTGKPRIFSGTEISADVLLASACLPTVFQAVEIPDPQTGRVEAYWDGGYMGNPALYPLSGETQAVDILIVHINPIEREELPCTATEILNRINEISFNASLVRELKEIDFVNRLIDEEKIPAGLMKRKRIHSISDDALMVQLGIATKMTPSWTLLWQLHEAGYRAMDTFLREHREEIGICSSLDIRAMFGALPL